MDLTAVLVQVKSVNEKKKNVEEKKDNTEEKNEEAEQRSPLVSAAPSAIPAADGRCPLPPIPEVDDEREPDSPAGSSQSLGYVAVPVIQPNETEAGAAVAAPHGAAPVTTTTNNNGRNNGGRRIVRVNTRTRNNLVASRRLLIQCLTQDVKGREQEIKMEREQLETKKKIRESPRWVGRVVGFCVLVVLCVLVVSALVKLILYYNTS
ncbi:uncharacterized protein LOC106653629 [Trichogramma pretiosum]|uniref:uncharacterized protein LOC106653629 n=1 Tax=Trichogramma pretiosum TaxID=7493 RepID=UPI0006C987F7|nr:uncharacterized protein LOC106653629 [Trichogramma pretiosum]